MNDEKKKPHEYQGDHLLRRREVRSIYGISKRNLQDLEFRGDLTPIQLGPKTFRFSAREVAEYIEKLKAGREYLKLGSESEFTTEEKETLNAICAEFPGIN